MILLIDLSFFTTNLHPAKEFNALKKLYVSGLQNWACKLFNALRNLTRFRITKFGQAVAADSAHPTFKGLTSKFQAQSLIYCYFYYIYGHNSKEKGFALIGILLRDYCIVTSYLIRTNSMVYMILFVFVNDVLFVVNGDGQGFYPLSLKVVLVV